MRYIKAIIMMAILAITTSAMRADDLSELVAAVAATQKTVQDIQRDAMTVRFDSLPRYTPKKADIDVDILDGICDAMTFRASLDFILNAYDEGASPGRWVPNPEYDYWLNRPTLSKEGFFRPVPGIITSRFGWRPQFQRVHHGVDLRLNVGDTVRAAMSGMVKLVAYDHDGYGNYVVMTHADGMETVYGHLQYALVSQGQHVDIACPVGIGGNTGNSTGPHLHFEARMDGVAVDPTLIFDFNGIYRRRDGSRVPDHTASAQSSRPIEGKRTYVVRQGDTAKSIARRAGISVLRLCQLNMIKETDRLQIGRMLKLK